MAQPGLTFAARSMNPMKAELLTVIAAAVALVTIAALIRLVSNVMHALDGLGRPDEWWLE